jgi:hypothetical protein
MRIMLHWAEKNTKELLRRYWLEQDKIREEVKGKAFCDLRSRATGTP